MTTHKEELKKAFEHGKKVGTYLLSNLSEKYAPLTFDSWYDEYMEEEFNKEDIITQAEDYADSTKFMSNYPHDWQSSYDGYIKAINNIFNLKLR